MKKHIMLLMVVLCASIAGAQPAPDPIFPVRGLAIQAPSVAGLDRFLKFVKEELATRQVNTLILRVDYNFQYESYPQMRDSSALSKADVKKLVDVCRKYNIRVIPQINLLGHQSWAKTLYGIVKYFPEFDETPAVKMPEKYSWPNPDGLYCKSYCPLHPDVHKVVFALVDEICDAFQADAFHAGMDEVFYIGDSKCPRCAGVDKAELFAGEVRAIRDHLAQKNRELWIWGDRLIDGKSTGMGMWEASMNNTYRAVDMIPKDVIICDWHYERPDQTPVYFAMKGLKVVTCPFRRPEIAVKQAEDMARFRSNSTADMKDRFYGMVQTVWSGADNFLDGFYGVKKDPPPNMKPGTENLTPWNSFRALYKRMDELKKESVSAK